MTVMSNVANARLPHLDDGGEGGPAAGATQPRERGGHYFLSDCSVAGTIKEGDKKVIFHDDRHERREVESRHGLISCGVSADEGGTTVTGGKPYFQGYSP